MTELEIAKLISQLPIASVNHKVFFHLLEFIFPLQQHLLNALGHTCKRKSRAKQTTQLTNFLYLDLHIKPFKFLAIKCQWKGPLFRTHNSYTPLHSYTSSTAWHMFSLLNIISHTCSKLIIHYNMSLADLGREESTFPGKRKEWKPQVSRRAKKNCLQSVYFAYKSTCRRRAKQ